MPTSIFLAIITHDQKISNANEMLNTVVGRLCIILFTIRPKSYSRGTIFSVVKLLILSFNTNRFYKERERERERERECVCVCVCVCERARASV